MKVFIFGIDALDYNFVKKWNLKGLKQKEYGRVIIPEEIELLSTPTLWATIITGQLPEKHGIKPGWYIGEYRRPLITKFRLIVKRLNTDKKVYEVLMSSKILNKTIVKLIQGKRVKQKFRLKCPTFFDSTRSVHINVPTYDKLPEIAYDIVKKQFEVFDGKMSKLSWEKLVRRRFEKTKRIMFKRISENWDLFMVYFAVLDHIQHVYFNDIKYIKRYYKEMEGLVKKVKRKLTKDILVLIISDHGMKRGIHTRYAFYSSNIKLNLKKPKLTDFYKVVKDRVLTNA
jgi:hypothetical protein